MGYFFACKHAWVSACRRSAMAKARKAEMDAMKERLRQEQVMVDRFQEERAKQEAEAKRKVERAAAKLMRKNRSEELGKQKLVDLHRFKAEAKRLNAAFNKKY